MSFFATVAVWSVIDLGSLDFDTSDLEIELVLAALFLSLSNLVLSVVRWRMIFDPTDRPSFSACLLTYCMSTFANIVVPFRGGDIARGYLVSTRRDLPAKAAAVTTVGIEKLFDLIALLILLVLWTSVMGSDHRMLTLVVMVAFFSASGLAVLVALHIRSTKQSPTTLNRLPSWIRAFQEGGGRASGAVLNARTILSLATLSLAIRGTDALIYLTIATMVGFPLSAFKALIFGAAIGVAVLIPASPGYIGTYEAAGLALLLLFGSTDENALKFIISSHLWQLIYGISIGIGALVIMRKSLRSFLATYKKSG